MRNKLIDVLFLALMLCGCSQAIKYDKVVKEGEDLPSTPFGFHLNKNDVAVNNPKLKFSIDASKATNTDSIITYSDNKNRIIVYKTDTNFIVVEAIIRDNSIKLRKGISVGISRSFFNTVIPEASNINSKGICLCNESEMVSLFFTFNQDDFLDKIDIINNEIDIMQ